MAEKRIFFMDIPCFQYSVAAFTEKILAYRFADLTHMAGDCNHYHPRIRACGIPQSNMPVRSTPKAARSICEIVKES